MIFPSKRALWIWILVIVVLGVVFALLLPVVAVHHHHHRSTSPPEPISAMNSVPTLGCVLLVVTLICHLGIQALGTLRLRKVRDGIQGKIKSRADLEQVRTAIEMNLFLGIPLLCNGVILLCVLFWVSSGRVLLACVIVLALEQVPSWFLFRPVEKQFKALPVESEDPQVAMEYSSYVKQWAGPHLFLQRSEPP